MALFLYDIFWSHFCEKARFCLDFKRLPYTIVRVNPFTRREVIALGARGDVPVLKDGEKVIVGSEAIASHLEEIRPEPSLLPAEPRAREETLALEREFDAGLGPDARRVAYEVALAHPEMLTGTILWRRPPKSWLNGLLLRFVEPRVRRKFKIHPKEVQESRDRLRRLLPEMQGRIARSGHLVGDRMTLADITGAALLDPLEIVPEFVRDPSYAPLFAWKRGLARAHGRRQRTPWLSGDPPPGYPRLALDEGEPSPSSRR